MTASPATNVRRVLPFTDERYGYSGSAESSYRGPAPIPRLLPIHWLPCIGFEDEYLDLPRNFETVRYHELLVS